jgi:hypothetical protein
MQGYEINGTEPLPLPLFSAAVVVIVAYLKGNKMKPMPLMHVKGSMVIFFKV